MRGVPHNHPPHKVKLLFANTKAAMAADSILLVDETVLPDRKVGFVAASIDLVRRVVMRDAAHEVEFCAWVGWLVWLSCY